MVWRPFAFDGPVLGGRNLTVFILAPRRAHDLPERLEDHVVSDLSHFRDLDLLRVDVDVHVDVAVDVDVADVISEPAAFKVNDVTFKSPVDASVVNAFVPLFALPSSVRSATLTICE